MAKLKVGRRAAIGGGLAASKVAGADSGSVTLGGQTYDLGKMDEASKKMEAAAATIAARLAPRSARWAI